jgi:hypothetical protein
MEYAGCFLNPDERLTDVIGVASLLMVCWFGVWEVVAEIWKCRT